MDIKSVPIAIAFFTATASLPAIAEGSSTKATASAISAPETSTTLEPAQALIKGFAKYQAGRVENMILNEFVSDLANEKIFKQFFPQTSNAVSDFSNVSGKRLIPMIQYFADQDIEKMKSLTEEIRENKACLGPLVKHLKDGNSIDNFSCKASKNIAASTTDAINDSMETFGLMESDPNRAAFDLNAVSDISRGTIFSTKIAEKIKSIEDNKKIPNAVYIARFLDLLQAAGAEEKEFFDFNKLRSAGIFLASLSDAAEKGDADAVTSAIEDFVDEDQAYNNKRTQTGLVVHRKGKGNDRFLVLENSVFLSSYFGLAVVDGADSELNYRPFGPVGIEMTLASFNGAPLSINYSPIDVGAYVTFELKGEDYDPRVEDITAPSVFFSYSLRNKPIAFMMGYQWDYKSIKGGEQDMAFFSVAFDLPLFTFF